MNISLVPHVHVELQRPPRRWNSNHQRHREQKPLCGQPSHLQGKHVLLGCAAGSNSKANSTIDFHSLGHISFDRALPVLLTLFACRPYNKKAPIAKGAMSA
jgi:hypothetical protein